MGFFLVLDGIDGAGKSTQLELLHEWLKGQGFDVVRCRDPGGTAIGERIREALLDRAAAIELPCEMLLYMASRAQLVREAILPALEKGSVVLCDRFSLSTVAYQGFGGGLRVDTIRVIGQFATGGLVPDWTGILDLDLAAAAGRRRGPADRIESRSSEFHQRVRDGFLAEAKRDPGRVTVIPADREPHIIHQQITSEVARVLGSTRRP